MAFENLDDTRSKLDCEESVKDLTDFYIANDGVLGNGIALFQDSSLTTLVEDGIYVLNTNTAIFRTVNGIVEILQEGV
jgi:hypothetical protein